MVKRTVDEELAEELVASRRLSAAIMAYSDHASTGGRAREFLDLVRGASRDWAMRHINIALDGQLRCGVDDEGVREAISVLRAALAELR